MKKIKFLVSCIIAVVAVSAAAGKQAIAFESGDVVINEIAWKTNAGDHEWMEFYNTTNADIDLTGWVIRRERDGKEVAFTDDSGDVAINLNNAIISANSYFFIERINAAGDSSAILTSTADFQSKDLYQFLQADGENLTLKDSSGNIIDNVDCSDGWYGGDDDNAMSMEKILPTASSNDKRWWGTYDQQLVAPTEQDADGDDLYGTPGAQNSIYGTYSPAAKPKDILSVQQTPFFPHGDHTPALSRIAYRNTEDGTMYATVTIYDIKGREVKHILRYEELSSDEWEYYEWDGKDDYGDILPMGVYIVHMRLEPGDAGSVEEARATVVLGRRF